MAQLPKDVAVGLPDVLAKAIISEKDVASINTATAWGQSSATQNYWVVWSDRADNTTYKGPSSSSGKIGQLNFNEQVRIAEIKNDYAHVYVESQEDVMYPQIKQATDKGWVPMTNLLLWSSCLANERGILNKVLIVVNLSDKISEKKNLFKVYTNPVTKTDIGYVTPSINVRFVMKEDRRTGMVLLANDASLRGPSDMTLYGWLNKDSYIRWNQRVCLEPNWENDVVEHFKSRGENLKVFVDPDLSGIEIIKPFKFGSIKNEDGRDVDRYRMPKGSLRYPIIDMDSQTNENVYHVCVFTQNGSLTEAAQLFEEKIEKNDSNVERAVPSMDSLEASFNEAFIAARLGKEYVNFMKKTNVIMPVPGYTPKKSQEGYDYWKTVLFISADELENLLHQLEGVYKAAMNSDYTNREPYVNAFKGFIQAVIPEMSNERLDAMSQEEIMANVAGLNAQTETTKKYSLQQLLNPKIIDNQTYANIINNFAEKYENLNRIKTSKYPFTLKVNRNIYYWIPTDMIP